VGVHYDSDPRQVKELLITVAKGNAQVMANPEPVVLFEDFGDDALVFKLFAYIFDVTKGIAVRTDLRISILEAFKAAGIEVPYRQTDVHLRNMEWLKQALLVQPVGSLRQRRKRRAHGRGPASSNGHRRASSDA
jgi:potassium-dependent mechanosensitive channel